MGVAGGRLGLGVGVGLGGKVGVGVGLGVGAGVTEAVGVGLVDARAIWVGVGTGVPAVPRRTPNASAPTKITTTARAASRIEAGTPTRGPPCPAAAARAALPLV